MCRIHAADVLRSTYVQDGTAAVVLVGSGSAAVGRDVAKELNLASVPKARLVVDPTYRVYAELGTKSGVLRTFTWRRWENVVGLLAFPLEALKGRFPMLNAGNQWLQGCTLVVSRDGTVRFGLIESSPGFPPLDKVAMAKAVRNEHARAVVPPADDGGLEDAAVGRFMRVFAAGAAFGAVAVFVAAVSGARGASLDNARLAAVWPWTWSRALRD